MFKRKSKISIVLAIFVCLVFSACGNKGVSNNAESTTKKATNAVVYPLKIVDSYNRTVTIEKEPKRIITIAPAITTETITVSQTAAMGR